QPGKSHQSDFGHASFAKAPEQLQLNAVSAAFCTDVSRMSTEPACFKNPLCNRARLQSRRKGPKDKGLQPLGRQANRTEPFLKHALRITS
ncbi:MAG: hypothetical protein WB341_13540, partial [Terracidiphilus sp.]